MHLKTDFLFSCKFAVKIVAMLDSHSAVRLAVFVAVRQRAAKI